MNMAAKKAAKISPAVFDPDEAPDEGWGVDRYEGDNNHVQGMWPHDKISPDEHAHSAACTGYFNHTHPDGGKPHSHSHQECEWCR